MSAVEQVKQAANTVAETVTSAAQQASSAVSGGKKAVHFGGGNIGRGFVADFLHRSGYEVVFVDVVDKLIESLQKTKSYTVTELSGKGDETHTITNYRAINSKTHESDVVHEIATADIVTCAVGPNILKFIAPVIAKGIDARKVDEKPNPLAVIACENMIGGTDKLFEFIEPKLESTKKDDLPDKARFANSAIDRIVPGQDPDAGLNVKLEKFYEWCVDERVFKDAKGGIPYIDGVHFVDDLEPYIERKLFTVNTGHATAAYMGHRRRRSTISEAMADPEIKKQVTEALEETAHLIVNKHGITKEDQEEYVQTIIRRISNPHLEDVVERVGRAPIRKLGRKERFVGPAAELAEKGDGVSGLLTAIEMCFRFQDVEGDDESKELKEIMDENGPEDVVKEVCGLKESEKLFPMVVDIVKKVQGELNKKD